MDNPEVLGRLLDYLLIRLITVFDPDFFRVFFLVFSLLQANEDVSFCDGADHSKKNIERVCEDGFHMLQCADK